MAPITKERKSAKEDDFVLTLSDEDENGPIEGSEDGDGLDANIESSKKRKRESETTETSSKGKKSKKQKKQEQEMGELQSTIKKNKKDKVNGGGKDKKKNKNDVAGSDEDEEIGEKEEGDEDDEEGATNDGALNPEFEFDVGGAVTRGVTDSFDEWGLEDGEKETSRDGNKKGVDIDEIILRRQAKKEAEQGKGDKKKGKQEDRQRRRQQQQQQQQDGNVDDDDDDGGMSVDFQDDELLAADGFGMGAGSEDESGQSEEEDASGSDSEDDNEDDEKEGRKEAESDDDQAASDDDSVASPVEHPDDVASGNDDSGDESENDPVEEEKRKAFFAPAEKSQEPSSTELSKGSFQDYNLSRPILRGITSLGFSNPTPIQRKTVPVALLGKDIVGSAVTGSGKTAAFVVPILERLLFRPRKVPTSRVAILMPTRELAVQCYNVATKLATFTDITFCQLVGGFSLREQENVLKRRPDVIIATPGRFIDHMRNSTSFTVDTLEILVLDEADRMLEDGFADELNEILTTIPKSRQTMLFSATMTDTVDKLVRVGLNRPVRLMVDSKKNTAGNLVQEFVRLRPGREGKRLGYLLYLCKEIYTSRVLIFFRQKREAHRIRVIFGLLGLKAVELHGSMSQEQRIKSVENFREGKVSFLLATDLASRGLDIKGIESVINYEAPQSHEIYLHRVGRTARAGRSGRACTIAAEPDRKVVKAAVKAGKAQGAKIVSRVVDPATADGWASKSESLKEEIDAVLQEEQEEKALAQADMQMNKGENLIKHGKEIMSRPKRTWFESEREKREAHNRGAIELNGPDVVLPKEKKKLSNKDKKRMDSTRARQEGNAGWKKSKSARETPKQEKSKEPGKKKDKKKGRK